MCCISVRALSYLLVHLLRELPEHLVHLLAQGVQRRLPLILLQQQVAVLLSESLDRGRSAPLRRRRP